MTEKKTQVITINDVEYTEDQLTDEQKMMINHIGDLDRKINSATFNMDQMQTGRTAYVNALTQSLETPPEVEAVN